MFARRGLLKRPGLRRWERGSARTFSAARGAAFKSFEELTARSHLFKGEKILSCAELNATKNGKRVKCAGVVITRQMPGDSGVVFMTLRDETGYCNALAWLSVFEHYRKEIMGSRIIVIEGEVQRSEEGVVHLISQKLYDRSSEIERLSEDRFRPQSHDDQMPPPADPRSIQRHPRHVRVLPKSRDFH